MLGVDFALPDAASTVIDFFTIEALVGDQTNFNGSTGFFAKSQSSTNGVLNLMAQIGNGGGGR